MDGASPQDTVWNFGQNHENDVERPTKGSKHHRMDSESKSERDGAAGNDDEQIVPTRAESGPCMFSLDSDPQAIKKRLESLLSLASNLRCADCNAKKPSWASTNNGVFICTQCAGVHRSLGVEHSFVLSTKLDKWSEDQVELVSLMDNAQINSTMEFSVPKEYKKPNGEKASRDVRERYIKAKYVKKLFEVGPNRRREAPILSDASSSTKSVHHGMVEYIGVLSIHLIEAKNLKGMDIKGLSNPYVILRVGAQAVTSSTVRHSLQPAWGETHLLSWDGISDLTIQLLDYKKIGPDRPMGHTSISREKLSTLLGSDSPPCSDTDDTSSAPRTTDQTSSTSSSLPCTDQEIDSWNQLHMRKDWAKNFGDHMIVGAEGVSKGIYSGITGVWMDPINGAKKDGVGGFAKGVGKGIAGVLYRPMKGIGTMVRETANGIRGQKYRAKVEMVPCGSIHLKIKLHRLDH